MKKMSLYAKYIIYMCFIVAACAMVILGALSDGIYSPVFWIGFAAAIAASVFQVVILRCPHCGAVINLRGGFPPHCAQCGEKLEEETA